VPLAPDYQLVSASGWSSLFCLFVCLFTTAKLQIKREKPIRPEEACCVSGRIQYSVGRGAVLLEPLWGGSPDHQAD